MTLNDRANLSTVWLAFLCFILGIIPAVLFYFAVRGMLIVNRKVPQYFKLGQYYSGIIRDQTEKVSQQVTKPVARAYGETARAQTIVRNLAPQPKASPSQTKEQTRES